MAKHHHQNKTTQGNNRMGTSLSIGPEKPEQNQMGFSPSYEDIQKRAYQIHEQKGGSDLENWLEAEQALKEEQHA